MRYYSLTLTNAKTGAIATRADGTQLVWTTLPNGQYDPSALNIEFDLPISSYAQPMGAGAITLEGIAIADLYQAQDFVGMNVVLCGGMSKGLPLANPAQQGVLVQGTVFQSFGNWVGSRMTIDFVVTPSGYNPDVPTNIVLNWAANTPLSDAIKQALSTAFPGAQQNISINPKLTLNHNEAGHYTSLQSFASAIKSMTKGSLGDNYTGVDIAFNGPLLSVNDYSVKSNAIPIVFTDFIGQPTWVDQNIMQMKTVLRGDLGIFSYVTMPPGLQSAPGIVQTSAASMPNYNKYKSAFQGQFAITNIRHVGNLRDPSGDSWVSIFNCVPMAV
jgi:hypothetical protein